MPKAKSITITINKKKYKAQEGETVLEVAKKNNIHIATLCQHPDLDLQRSCRLCMVEVKGLNGLHTSCDMKVKTGMVINTESDDIARARRINTELIFTEHCEECADCIKKGDCTILDLAKKHNIKINKFSDRKKGARVYKFGPALEFDTSKCVDCGLCVDMCHKEGVDFLEFRKEGKFVKVLPSKMSNKDCIYCGQCLMHCPVGAFEGSGEFEEIDDPFKDKSKTVVFQFAPSIRTAIGEEFGMPYGSVMTEKMAAGIKALGADYVFDTAVGADFTTVAEAEELIERIKGKGKLPMFTSCCPAWVKWVEFYRPELIPNLTTVRSPQILFGGVIKTYWAKKMKIDPKDIVVVSIMPCVAKKYEITRNEMKIDGIRPVDYVLTTRELARLFKKHKVDLAKIKPGKIDSALGKPTGAGVIYGASGGVMESALRTAYKTLTGKKLPKINLTAVRGLEGCKKAEVDINGTIVKVAVVNGILNARAILDELKKDPHAYDYIEVMACIGGCIGGGGQPVPVNADIRQKRANSLYSIDVKTKIRYADENLLVKEVYKKDFKDHAQYHKVCHSTFRKKKKELK